MKEHLLSILERREYVELVAERGLKVLLIIALVFVCAKLMHVVSKKVLKFARKSHADKHSQENDKRIATVVKLLDTSLRVMLYTFGFLMVLREFGLDITPFLTGAGIAGVAVGFGAQSLVKDFFSGFFLLIEDQIRVGDVIKINGSLSGSVERMELRVTAIRDGDGTLHIIPNGSIQSVSNMTYKFGTAVVDIPVAYRNDLKTISSVLAKVASDFAADPKWKEELLGDVNFIGIVKFEADYMVVELTARTEPHSRWAVTTELRARAKIALDASGIEYPRRLMFQLEKA